MIPEPVIDPELGPVLWCRGCREWWPDDAEFWHYYTIPVGKPIGRGYFRKTPITTPRCRACGQNWRRPRIVQRRSLILARVVETPEGLFLEPVG